MIQSVLRTLLPLFIVTLAAMMPKIHFAADRQDLESATNVSREVPTSEDMSPSQSFASLQPNAVTCQPSGTVPATNGIRATLSLLSDQTAKALFGSRISKAYYVIETSFSDVGLSGFVVTGLQLCSAEGAPILVTSPQVIAAKVSHRPKMVPEWLLGQECLVPKWLTNQGVVVPGRSDARTRLFVEKGRLELEHGMLPPGLQLFGEVSETLFVTKTIRATY